MDASKIVRVQVNARDAMAAKAASQCALASMLRDMADEIEVGVRVATNVSTQEQVSQGRTTSTLLIESVYPVRASCSKSS